MSEGSEEEKQKEGTLKCVMIHLLETRGGGTEKTSSAINKRRAGKDLA